MVVDSSKDVGCLEEVSLVDVLADIPSDHGHVQEEREPIAKQEEENTGTCLEGSFRRNELEGKGQRKTERVRERERERGSNDICYEKKKKKTYNVELIAQFHGVEVV